MTITTPLHWWNAVDERWSDIMECFMNAGADLGSQFWSDGPGLDATDHGKRMGPMLEDARRQRDHRFMRRMLGLLWMAAPDSPSIHSWPSWDVVCDLCSEDWVFEDAEHDASNVEISP